MGGITMFIKLFTSGSISSTHREFLRDKVKYLTCEVRYLLVSKDLFKYNTSFKYSFSIFSYFPALGCFYAWIINLSFLNLPYKSFLLLLGIVSLLLKRFLVSFEVLMLNDDEFFGISGSHNALEYYLFGWSACFVT